MGHRDTAGRGEVCSTAHGIECVFAHCLLNTIETEMNTATSCSDWQGLLANRVPLPFNVRPGKKQPSYHCWRRKRHPTADI